MKCGFLLFVCLLLPWQLAAQDVSQLDSTRKDLESEIVTCVDNLIAQSEASTESLLRAMSRLESASSEAAALKTERDDLKSSSEAISKSLNESKKQIVKLLQSVKFWKKACIIVFLILLALAMAVGIVLYLELTKKTNFI